MKIVKIKGEEYKILPSLKNMCLIEEDMPGYNLALGVPAEKANLRFMASCIKRCIVTMDDKPLPKEVFEDISLAIPTRNLTRYFLRCSLKCINSPRRTNRQKTETVYRR